MAFNDSVSGLSLCDRDRTGATYANERSRQENRAKKTCAFHDLPIAKCESCDPVCHQAVTPSVQVEYLHIVKFSLETPTLRSISTDCTYQIDFVVKSVLQRLRSVQVSLQQ